MTYARAVERLIQAVVDEHSMTDESAAYRAYVESEAYDMITAALEDFDPMGFDEWHVDGLEDARARAEEDDR